MRTTTPVTSCGICAKIGHDFKFNLLLFINDGLWKDLVSFNLEKAPDGVSQVASQSASAW